MSVPLRPSIRYAQNFLRDPRLVAALLDRFCLESESTVYEIGPGKGIITEQLALRYRQVVAIEKDPRLANLLRRTFADRPNVTISSGDFLCYRLPHRKYQVMANIPFNVTAAIVTKLTTAECPPENAYLTMQREAADALVGKPHASLRTILLQPWFAMEIVHHFQRTNFIPAPHVDVVMLRLRKRGPPLVRRADRQYFRDFVTRVFTAWQPTVAETLKHLCTRQHFNALRRRSDFDLNGTPTSLTLEQWLELFASFQSVGDKQALAEISGSEKRLMHRQNRVQKIHRTRAGRSKRPRAGNCAETVP
jgi:23S rRNA (adenine-N6)-dimethyltransferase